MRVLVCLPAVAASALAFAAGAWRTAASRHVVATRSVRHALEPRGSLGWGDLPV